MRIAVIGAGGIGGFYAAKLARAGHSVVVCARGQHLRAIQNRGLMVTHPTFRFADVIVAVSLDEFFRCWSPTRLDLILLCTKSDVTDAIGRQLAHWFSSRGVCVPVLSLQNGVDNERRLAGHINPGAVLGGLAVRIGARVSAPGCIDAVGVAQLIVGVWPNTIDAAAGPAADCLDDIIGVMRGAGIEVQKSGNILRELWRKLVINNGVNPLSALTGMDSRQLTSNSDTSWLVRALMEETARAAAADGIVLDATDVEEMFELISSFDAIKTSMLIDREAGRPMEVNDICGAVISRSDVLDIESPYTHMIASLLAVIEHADT